MVWSEQSPRYTPKVAIEDPYRAAAKTWDGRYGEALIQARNWRLLAVGLLAVLIIEACGVVWALQQRRDVPYVVVLDQQGEDLRIEVAHENYTPTDGQIAYHLQQWLRWVRSRPLDPLVFKQNWTRAYAFLANEAKAKMNAHAQEQDPKEDLGTIARDVTIKNIRRRSDRTFEIAWTEADWRDGQRLRQAAYSGTFLVRIVPPTTTEQIARNPLGVTIVEFGWSPDLAS